MLLKNSALLITFFWISSLFSGNNSQIDLFSGDWQLSVNDSIRGKINLPYLSFDLNEFKIKRTFSFSDDSTINNVFFQCDGFSGNASIFINNNLIYEQKNTNTPININILKDYLINDETNTIEIRFLKNNSSENNFPRFTQTYTSRYPLGVSQKMALIFQEEEPFYDFNYTLEQNNGRWILKYSLNLNNDYFLGIKREGLRFSEKISFTENEILSQRLINITPSSQKIERIVNINNKYLWAPENPVFLSFEFQVRRYDNILESKLFKTGVRKPQENNERLFLNAEQIKIKGINYHADHIIDTSKVIADFKMIKKMGFNAVRFPNLIPDETYFSIADTLGLLLFCDFPIKRYPSDLFDDALLQLARRSASMTISSFIKHPSFFAFGLGQEVDLNNPLVQKFFIIFNRAIKKEQFLTYISTIPLPFKTTEIASDFYIIDHYNISPEYFDQIGQLGIPYLLDGRSGIAIERSKGTVPPANFLHSILDLREKLNLQGGFLESYRDWQVKFESLNSKPSGTGFKITSGIVDSSDIPLPWVATMESNIWDYQNIAIYKEDLKNRGNNFFSIIMFFGFLIFFFFYRRYPRFREHYVRALRHTYGFFVDMRERRIIPIFISTSTGLHNSLIAAVFFGSFIYYWRNSVLTHEILSLFFTDPQLHSSVLNIIQSVWLIIITLWFLFFMHPVLIGTILKILSLISPVRIRYRQAIVIGFWSAAPFIFFLPVSLAAIHLMYNPTFTFYMIAIFIIFILWTHIRLINGIRILFVARIHTVISFLLLSYIVPVAIFLGFYNPVPNWFDYLNFLLNSGYLF